MRQKIASRRSKGRDFLQKAGEDSKRGEHIGRRGFRGGQYLPVCLSMVLVVVLVAIVARTCLVISGHKAIPFHATEVKHDSVFEGDHDDL